MANHFEVTVIHIAGCEIEGQNLTLVIDNEMQLESIKPACGAFPPVRKTIEDPMRVNPPVVTHIQRGGVDKADAATLANPALHHVYCKCQEADPHQFHKAVVADQMREIAPQIHAQMVFVIPFEGSIIRQVKQDANGHNLRQAHG